MLARREHYFAKGDHSLSLYSLSDDSKRLLPNLAIGDDVVWTVQIEFVDLFFRHELVDFDRALALDGDCLKLLGVELDICAFADLVALDDLLRIDFLAGLCIDLAILDAVSGILVDLMKADFLALRCGWEQGNRTRHKRQFEIALPIRTRGHDLLHTNDRHWFHTNERHCFNVEATPFRIQSGGPFAAEFAICVANF